MRFVIVGGDAAGMSAASRAKRQRPDLEVTVLEQTQDVSYSACGMPYNIADPQRRMEDLVVRPARVFREKQGIHLLTGHRVDQVNPARHQLQGRTLSGEPFELAYDKLLLATGAAAARPDLPGLDLPRVVVLKSLADGRRIRELLDGGRIRKVVIIGMGYIALEMVEALRARALKVAMVKPGPVFMPWMAPEMAQQVQETVESNQVALYPGRAVDGIENGRCAMQVVCDGVALEADMVLVAIGIKPNNALASKAHIALGPAGAIAVDRQLRTSAANIYAAGDCADAFHVVTGEKAWIPLALRANRGGWAAADHVCGKTVGLQGVAGTAVFKVFELQVARTGLTANEAKQAGFVPETVTIKTRSRAHAHPGAASIWVHMVGDAASGRLLGVQMVGREGVAHRINAAAVALHAQMTVAQFSQTDLSYAPPFGPVWDPLLTAANQLLKKL